MSVMSLRYAKHEAMVEAAQKVKDPSERLALLRLAMRYEADTEELVLKLRGIQPKKKVIG